ncbi:MAG: metallophosphoesterase [Lachnospiraceae bacterium]|nr:metallophosphoesterase [Lachnospiraceae bacterium]
MQKHTIVHISDLHISLNNLNTVRELKTALIKDIKEHITDSTIDMIVCSGDLVFSGKEENFEMALDDFVAPLLNAFNLSEDSFIYVPGNHEIDINKIDPDFAMQFTKRVLTDGVKKSDLCKSNVTDRLSGFYSFSEIFNKLDNTKIVTTKIVNFNNIKYGISLVNTAWNSSGNSRDDAKRIVVLRDDFVDSINLIEQCDKKILVMHHPIDWYEDNNAAEIELLLGKYDFVLTGHKHHENNCEVSNMNGRTIINATSKLDISNGENGYSIIQFSTETSDVSIINRCYVKSRMTFAPNIRIADDGLFVTKIEPADYDRQLICDIVLHTRRGFYQNIDKLFITNLLEVNEPKKFDDLFVEPIVSRHSELTKARYDEIDDEKIDVFEEININKYTILWGRKEAGKTIFANYIAKRFYDNYTQSHLIPVIIDCRFLGTYKTALIKEIGDILNNLCDSDFSIRKIDIERICQNGAFLIILDNYDNTYKQNEQLKAFENAYPSNKFVFFRNEMPAVFSDEDKITLINSIDESSSVNLFIRAMDKHNIRLLAKNMTSINPTIEDAYVNRIIYSFSTNNMPRTPFAVSLILAICDEMSDYMPTNQAKIVELFMEKLLEKLNPQEVYSRTYDFSNKEKYLAELAFEIYKTHSYFISKDAFYSFTIEYHNKKAYELSDSKFDKLFFEKGILSLYDDKVFFRYECLNHYYLAKYCLFNQDFFSRSILASDFYLNYCDVIAYYAGMDREDKKLLTTLIEYAKPYITSHADAANLLEQETIKMRLNISEDEIRDIIGNTKQLPTEEKDKLTDVPDKSIQYNPIDTRTNIEYDDNAAFSLLIELLGKVLRSSEELEATVKKDGLSVFISGCIILWQKFRESLLEFAQAVNEEIIVKKQVKENKNFKEINESLEKAYNTFCDIIKLSVPLAMSGFIFDSVGTDKMKKIFLETYNLLTKDSPERLLLVLLICDLKISNWNKILMDYIKSVSKRDYQWIIFFKCQHYLQFNYFSENTNKIIEPMADCFIAANNYSKQSKSKIIGELKTKKLLMPFSKTD